MLEKIKLIRITTIPGSFNLLKGQMALMRQNGFDVILGSAAGNSIETAIKNEKCRHVVFPLTRKITPLKDLLALYQLYRFLKKEKPQIVHSHTPKAGTVGMVASKLAGVQVRLHTIAGLPLMEAQGIKRKLLIAVEKVTYACATKVYPNSFGLREFILQNKFCPAKKLHVIGNGSSNGIDTNYFQSNIISDVEKKELQKQLEILSTDLVFIFVGRIVKDKGINELVSAFKAINRLNRNTKLLLVGESEPDLDPLLSKTQQEIENNTNIIPVGYQNDVRPYFAISHILVFPSYREGFPNVVMQAGAMDLPSIVSNINGCNEIIIHEKNGLIIPPKNEAALEAAILELMENKEKRNRLAQNARLLIVERYEQQMIWQLIKQEYDRQLEKTGIVF